jgi:hypothetical protein
VENASGRRNFLPLLGARFDGGAQDHAEEMQSGWHPSPMIALWIRQHSYVPDSRSVVFAGEVGPIQVALNVNEPLPP